MLSMIFKSICRTFAKRKRMLIMWILAYISDIDILHALYIPICNRLIRLLNMQMQSTLYNHHTYHNLVSFSLNIIDSIVT